MRAASPPEVLGLRSPPGQVLPVTQASAPNALSVGRLTSHQIPSAESEVPSQTTSVDVGRSERLAAACNYQVLSGLSVGNGGRASAPERAPVGTQFQPELSGFTAANLQMSSTSAQAIGSHNHSGSRRSISPSEAFSAPVANQILYGQSFPAGITNGGIGGDLPWSSTAYGYPPQPYGQPQHQHALQQTHAALQPPYSTADQVRGNPLPDYGQHQHQHALQQSHAAFQPPHSTADQVRRNPSPDYGQPQNQHALQQSHTAFQPPYSTGDQVRCNPSPDTTIARIVAEMQQQTSGSHYPQNGRGTGTTIARTVDELQQQMSGSYYPQNGRGRQRLP